MYSLNVCVYVSVYTIYTSNVGLYLNVCVYLCILVCTLSTLAM